MPLMCRSFCPSSFSFYLCLINNILIYRRKDAFFVDLFVRMSNNVAVDMYKQLGYVIYRRVLEYYSGDPDEDAYGEELFIIVALHARTYMNHIELKQKLLDIMSCPCIPQQRDS